MANRDANHFTKEHNFGTALLSTARADLMESSKADFAVEGGARASKAAFLGQRAPPCTELCPSLLPPLVWILASPHSHQDGALKDAARTAIVNAQEALYGRHYPQAYHVLALSSSHSVAKQKYDSRDCGTAGTGQIQAIRTSQRFYILRELACAPIGSTANVLHLGQIPSSGKLGEQAECENQTLDNATVSAPTIELASHRTDVTLRPVDVDVSQQMHSTDPSLRCDAVGGGHFDACEDVRWQCVMEVVDVAFGDFCKSVASALRNDTVSASGMSHPSLIPAGTDKSTMKSFSLAGESASQYQSSVNTSSCLFSCQKSRYWLSIRRDAKSETSTESMSKQFQRRDLIAMESIASKNGANSN
ncbi:hypothetical protein AC578_1462 [Pseudocercospora eumusae]|uniref:Uncharacterized protein n=1 Tax=Pseudocercospora eumusae TaxID=321146 RepID=A0A139H6L7_9PEZI|nr:hypothetical protein AC578_1462 [Pseudocercospora eumusae]